MITMQSEPWTNFWRDGAQLVYNAYAEVGEGLPFDPDVSGYGDLYDKGRLLVLTVRDDGVMIGYTIFVVLQHFHSKTLRSAFEEGLYLTPERRKGTLGVQLLVFAEAVLVQLGVGRVYMTERLALPLERLYVRRGYKLIARQWAKNLEAPNG
jgi:GNAT superfamily N-acetyltransferase